MIKLPHLSLRLKASIALLVVLTTASIIHGQATNPFESDPRAPAAGGVIFRAQCATCHGADAKGIDTIDAPDLTLLWTRASTTDQSVFQTIRQGISGSIMPPHSNPDPEIWMTVSYLKSVAVAGTSSQIVGDAGRGGQLFASNCSRCHRVDGSGGSMGPDLSSITGRRSQQALINSIREPSSTIARRYQPVTLITADNETIEGTLKSEDAFSIQVMDSSQRLRAFMKSDLSRLQREGDSIMPRFSNDALSTTDINDILSYLQSNRGRRPAF